MKLTTRNALAQLVATNEVNKITVPKGDCYMANDGSDLFVGDDLYSILVDTIFDVDGVLTAYYDAETLGKSLVLGTHAQVFCNDTFSTPLAG